MGISYLDGLYIFDWRSVALGLGMLALLAHVDSRLAPCPRKLRLGVAHAGSAP